VINQVTRLADEQEHRLNTNPEKTPRMLRFCICVYKILHRSGTAFPILAREERFWVVLMFFS